MMGAPAVAQDNTSTVTQSGDGQSATVNQTGANDLSTVTQSNADNTATVNQNGGLGGTSLVTQSGAGNTATLNQTDDGADLYGQGFVPPSSTSTIDQRSEEHTSELQSLMRISFAVFCLKKKMISNL